jgi:glycosyltransferase involved in cell wall biosynthesis
MSTNFSLVLPCYNEELNIDHLYEEFKNLPDKNLKKELIFVNNGSTDKTEENIDKVIIQSINDKNSNLIIKKINLSKNQGYGGGIKAGLKIARGDYIGWTHADLQTPLIDFLKLFNLIKNKKKIFGKGVRTNNRGYSGIVSRIHEFLASKILGFNLKEINAQPKIFSKDVLEYFTNIPLKWTTLDTYVVYICLKNKIEINEISVIFNNRIYGESKWQNNFSNFIKHIFFNLIYLVQLRFQNEKKKS